MGDIVMRGSKNKRTDATEHYSEIFRAVCEFADDGMLSEATERRVRKDARDLLRIVTDEQRKVLKSTLSDCLKPKFQG